MSGGELAIVFIASFLGVALLTPIVRQYAKSHQITDNPDGPSGRKLQVAPVPYLGGVAMAVGMSLVVLVGSFLRDTTTDDALLAADVLIPALILALVGYLDDRKNLNVFPRLMTQIIAGVFTGVVVFGTGTRSSLTGNLFLDAMITIVWVVGLINAMNFMDNMDGASSVVGAIAALTFFLIALGNGQYLVAALSLALAGALAGFLIFNWAPASIYMGDAGALFIGFLLAVIGIRLNNESITQVRSLAIPVLIMGIPIIDTTTVVISRIRRGVSPLQGGRDHLSHRIHARVSKRVENSLVATRITVLILGVASALLAAVAYLLSR